MGNTTSELVDFQPNGNEFLRQMSRIILDESKLVGNGEFMKRNHLKIVDFKYPHEIEKLIDFTIDDQPETESNLLDFCRKSIAYSIKTNHPHYMNSLYGGVDQFGIAGAWLTDVLNSSAAIWESSPVFAVIEKHIIKFMGKMAGFTEVDGLFSPGGSMANGYAIMLARNSIYNDVKEKGVFGRTKLVLFVSDQAHYSFTKMAIMLGHGTESVVTIKSDDTGHMIPSELEKRIQECKRNKHIPFFVAATAGTTVFGSFDPIIEINNICKKHNLWFHVDGALGGTWLFSGKYKKLLAGLENADSFTWDLHKMASVPIYCSMILVNKKNQFHNAFSLNAEYLFQVSKYYDKTYDPGDKSIQCTRKVEAFKLFLFLKAHGLKELERNVDNVFELSRYFEDQISKRKNFQLLFPRQDSNNICFYYIPDSYINKEVTPDMLSMIATELKRRMMEASMMMVAYQTIDSKNIPACFRMTISALPVYEKEDIDFIIDEFDRVGRDIFVG